MFKKVGVYGGAFDPTTRGHNFVARVVAKHPHLVDEVWVMPAYQHRFGKEMAAPEHRLEMCRLLFADDPKIVISNYEIARKLTGSTYETLLWLNKTYPENEFHVVIGADNANHMDQWTNWEVLVDEFPFIIVPRHGVELDPKVKWYQRKNPITEKPQHRILPLTKARPDSSTHARMAIKSGDRAKIDEVLNPVIWDYVLAHKLYGAKPCLDIPMNEPVSLSS